MDRTLRMIFLNLALVLLAGCAAHQSRTFRVDRVGGDLWIRDIASDSQMPSEGTGGTAKTPGMPLQGIPEINIGFQGRGMLSTHDVIIGSVSGSLYIDRAMSNNQGIDQPALAGKLFKPGDPFAVNE